MDDQSDSTWPLESRVLGGIGAYRIDQATVTLGLKLPTVIFAGLCLAVWLVIYINRRQLIGSSFTQKA